MCNQCLRRKRGGVVVNNRGCGDNVLPYRAYAASIIESVKRKKSTGTA